jgi:histidinol dehydrogenase
MKIYSYPSGRAEKKISSIINRDVGFKKKDIAAVARIIEDVRKNGDRALIQYTRRFDSTKVTAQSIRVSPEEIDRALARIDRSFTRALNRAAAQIKAFHERQIQESWMASPRPGTILGQLFNPVDCAGVYVPGGAGGTTPLVSSVLMGVIPAKIAGVSRISMVTPPMSDGTVSPFLLAAAKKGGVSEVYKVGSAWAIAALAYGTKTIPKTDVIVGPGNIYVTLAKKLVAGTVGIDMIAGPSEILIIADETANPEFVAADLLSQAEHDAMASAVLVTNSRDLADAVPVEVEKQLDRLDRKEIAKASLERHGAILIVPGMGDAIALANRIAPEHLELHVRDPFEQIGEIRHAGAVFIGEYTPEPVGDYIAGPNHVLPTAGTARFSSALSVDHFMKKTSVIHYSRSAFQREAKDIIQLADIEGLDAHANAVKVRLNQA